MTTTALAPSTGTAYSQEQRAIIRRTFCVSPKGQAATDDEFELFIQTCERTGLDPFARQIYAVFRWDSGKRREVMTAQVSIDGFRLIAERSNQYAGQIGPEWCGPDGVWRDLWMGDGFPYAARVGVCKRGFSQPLYAVAKWSSYVQRTKDDAVTRMWRQIPDVMLGKCAESLALRRAFPAELSGLYSDAEMAQATIIDVEPTEATSENVKRQPRKALAEQAGNGRKPEEPPDEPAPEPDEPEQNGEPEPPEEPAPVADRSPDTNPMRAAAIRRYRQLAAVAKERGHERAAKINAVDPSTLDDSILSASVKALEGYFPDVPEAPAEAVQEVMGIVPPPFGWHGNEIDPEAGGSIQRHPCQAARPEADWTCKAVLQRGVAMDFGGKTFDAGALMDRSIRDYGRVMCPVHFREWDLWAKAQEKEQAS